MLPQLFVAATAVALGAAQELRLGKSYTGWDCCKPVCADQVNQNILDSRGTVRTCRADGSTLDTGAGMSAPSGCNGNRAAGNAAYTCGDFAPLPTSDDMAYGFAIEIVDGSQSRATDPACCKCYELEWLTGAAADLGRKMTVQVVTPGQAAGNVTAGDLIIMAPGGGTGPFGETGCSRQWGSDFEWGPQYGGIEDRSGCEGLPPDLQGGCYWRFNWAGGIVNGWDIVYKQVQCPSRLRQLSGCAVNP